MAPPSQFIEHRRNGFHFISQALQCEETGEDEEIAKALYSLGIKELEAALASEDCSEEARLQLLRSMCKAKDRLEFLSTVGQLANLDSPSRQRSTDRRNDRPQDLGSPRRRPEGRESPTTPAEKKKFRVQSNKTTRLRMAALNEGSTTDRTHPSTKGTPSREASPNTVEKKSNTTLDRYRSELDTFLASTIVKPNSTTVGFGDVIGQGKAKSALEESVVLPRMRPELFMGLRRPAKGILLFGPPGNGKTLLAKALARESQSTLFNITASALTSKWVGEGEKLVKSLFELARKKAPALIFIDEIDSILCSRRETDNESSRRLKTEFFASFDGLATDNERLLVVGATNRPFDIDDAAVRRFTKRIYVEMPDLAARSRLVAKLLSDHPTSLDSRDIELIAKATSGYSASDLTNLAREAAFGPIRELGPDKLKTIRTTDIRSITLEDFRSAVRKIRPSVPQDSLLAYEQWNNKYGDVS